MFDASSQLLHPFALYADIGETLVLYRARRKRNDRAIENGWGGEDLMDCRVDGTYICSRHKIAYNRFWRWTTVRADPPFTH